MNYLYGGVDSYRSHYGHAVVLDPWLSGPPTAVGPVNSDLEQLVFVYHIASVSPEWTVRTS